MFAKHLARLCAFGLGWLVVVAAAAAGPNEPLSIQAAPGAGQDAAYTTGAAVRSALSRTLSQPVSESEGRTVPAPSAGERPGATSWSLGGAPAAPGRPARAEAAPRSPGAPRAPRLAETVPISDAEASGGREPATVDGDAAAGAPVDLAPPSERAPLGLVDPGPAAGVAPGRFPDAGAGSANASGWLTTVTGLGMVVGLIFTLRALVNRAGGAGAGPRSNRVLEVLCRVPLGPRSHAMIVRVGRRVLVVGESAGGLRTLADMDDAEEVADVLTAAAAVKPGGASRPFAQLLSKFNTNYSRAERRSEEGEDGDEFLVDRARDQVSSLLWRVRSRLHAG